MPKLYLIILTFTLGAVAAGGASARCGDCNDDGSVSVLDALLAAQYSLGINSVDGSNLEACNPIGDGQVDIMDVLALAQAAVQGNAFPDTPPGENTPCGNVSRASQLEEVVNTQQPQPMNLADVVEIQYMISSPTFNQTTVELSWSIDGSTWEPCTGLLPPTDNAPRPTTSVLERRTYVWDAIDDLAAIPPIDPGLVNPPPMIVYVRIESFSWVLTGSEVEAGTTLYELQKEPGEILVLDFVVL